MGYGYVAPLKADNSNAIGGRARRKAGAGQHHASRNTVPRISLSAGQRDFLRFRLEGTKALVQKRATSPVPCDIRVAA